MKDKEIAELRRRLTPDRHNITHIFGCYVSEGKEIITTFTQSLGLMTQEDTERYLSIFKKALSGNIHKNQLDITFTTKQVQSSEEHGLLMKLRESKCEEEESRTELFRKIIQSQPLEGNYLILLMHNTYDVPFKSSDGETQEASDTVFSYLQCCLCPVKLTKSVLQYKASESEFLGSEPGWTVAAPQLGFLFPAFDDRATNIYNALFYTHDTAESNEELIAALFKTEAPMPAKIQQNAFQNVLEDALQEECSFSVLQKVHGELTQKIILHKESRDPEPLTVTGDEVKQILSESGVSEPKAAKFGVKFTEEFGAGAEVSPANIINRKKFELTLPQVSIKVDPEYTDLVETRILGGVKYIVIKAEEGVEVNGVPVKIKE